MVRILEFLDLESPMEATVASVSTRGYITFQGTEVERRNRLEVAIAKDQDDPDEGTPMVADNNGLRLSDLEQVEQRAGNHSIEAILIAAGPNLRQDVRLPDSYLVDIAPTLLHLLGVPVAEDMDGRVLEEIFDPSFLVGHPVDSVSSSDDAILQQRQQGWEDGDEETLRKELEALGYLN